MILRHILLGGAARRDPCAERLEADGSRTLVGGARAGDGFGEAPLLTGKTHMQFLVTATRRLGR